jgi:hypothetical protein
VASEHGLNQARGDPLAALGGVGHDDAESSRRSTGAPLMLSGYAALAESEWMGAAQAPEVLEPLHVVAPPRRAKQ